MGSIKVNDIKNIENIEEQESINLDEDDIISKVKTPTTSETKASVITDDSVQNYLKIIEDKNLFLSLKEFLINKTLICYINESRNNIKSY